MTNQIQSIPLDKLVPHPANPNKMSKANFVKLVRNIERTGRYEPLIVRSIQQSINRQERKVLRGKTEILESSAVSACSAVKEYCCFQIINGHHRWLALKELGKKEADAIVWDIDDEQADILLATLNRLCGQDVLEKKLALLKRLSEKMQTAELAKLLPQTKAHIEKLTYLHLSRVSSIKNRESSFSNPLVFFVSDEQQQVIETALNFALQDNKPAKYLACRFTAGSDPKIRPTKAARRASALSAICRYYLDHKQAQIKALLGFKE